MTGRVALLEDELEFQTVPFLVKIEERVMFVNAETGECRVPNMYDAPKGLKKGGKMWVKCDCVIARIRPDYPYAVEKEWPENVDKHFSIVKLLDVPKKEKGLLFTSYSSEQKQTRDDVDIQKMAKAVIAKMKKAYRERDKVVSIEQ